MANPYGGTDSVRGVFHVQVAGTKGERVHAGGGAVRWHMARQLCRSLLADVAIGFEFSMFVMSAQTDIRF